MFGGFAIPAVFGFLEDIAVKSIVNPKSERARLLLPFLVEFDEGVDAVIAKIKAANPDLA